MPLPELVLIDTSAFYALISASDEFHQKAKQSYERAIDWQQQLWTTSYILVEMNMLVHKRLGFGSLRTFIESIQNIVRVYWIDQAIHDAAWRSLVESDGEGLSFVDWTTVMVARRLGAHVFTFDRGFLNQGIPVVPKRITSQ